MKRSLFVLALIAALLFAFVAFAADSTGKGKAASVDKSAKRAKPGKSAIALEAADPIIFTDDFEDLTAHWIPDASWGDEELGSGHAYDPETNWSLADDNANSGTYSWHAVEDNSECDFLISPVISLPTEVEVEGITSELKGLKLGHWLDVDTPGGDDVQDTPLQGEAWEYLFGPEEVVWELSATMVAAGASAYYLDPANLSTEYHWRQWLVSDEIDLTAATGNIALTFSHNYQSEVEFDYYAVDVSTDDFISYTSLGSWQGARSGWIDENFDLTPFAGKVIKLRFGSKGDYGTAEGSWAIDEIKVTDGSGDLWYDDGGEDGTMKMLASGFTGGNITNGLFQRTYSTQSQPTPAWFEYEPFEVAGFNTNWGPGSDVRIAIQWQSEIGDALGRGLYIDDVTLYGVGILAQDIALAGVNGLLTAALDKPFTPSVTVQNMGLNDLNGSVIWTGTIKDGDETVHVLTSAPQPIANFSMDSSITIPTLPARAWTPTEAGYFTIDFQVIFNDGDPANNMASYDIWVPGGAWSTPIYRCDFEPYNGETSLEDFGWTVVNGGGNDLTGLNVNKFEYIPMIYGDGAATLSAFWGIVDPGDYVAPFDSSEVLEEYIVSPPIDVSKLDKHNTLGLNYYLYWRGGYTGYDDYGVGHCNATIDWSADGGTTWTNVMTHWDDDSLSGTGPRLPNYWRGMNLAYTDLVDVDITAALMAAKNNGGNTVWLRLGTFSENSFFVASSFDELTVYAGINQPLIKGVVDVPEDNGKAVGVVFKGSANDLVMVWPEEPIGDIVGLPVIGYEVWRGQQLPAAGLTSYADMTTLFNAVHNAELNDTYYVAEDDMAWTLVANVPAREFANYGVVVPTLMDELATPFIVLAHTVEPLVWSMSAPKEGMSADNLAPAAPTALLVVAEDTKNTVTWEEAYSPVDDVKYYSLYRAVDDGSLELLATTIELAYVDAEVELGKKYTYAVSATDFAGNESVKSNEGSVVTSVERRTSAKPTEYMLSQNYPNPFNPTTTIEFATPEAGNVTLTVFNTNGQVIETLYSGHREAGYHKVVWDASKASAGIYFLEVRANNFTKMIKMMLVK